MTGWKRPPVVEVQWLDSMGYPGWRKREELETSCERTDDLDHITSGYLVVNRRDYVTVALSLGRGGSAGDAIQIPRKAIKAITTLRTATSILRVKG